MTLVVRLYRLALFALPARLRQEFGAEMVQLFADHWHDTAGALARIRFLIASIIDVLTEASSARFAARAHSTAPRGRIMRNFIIDFRHGLRLLRRYPSTTLLAILTLGIGIGANTAIFSVVNAVLLKSLPYPRPEQLVSVHEKRPAEGAMDSPASPADFEDWRRLNTSFSSMAALTKSTVNLTGAGDPVQLMAAVCSYGLFDVFGVQPFMGRGFLQENEIRGRHHVVVLTHALWMQQFGGDLHILDRSIMLNGNPWRVVGVMPEGFSFVDRSVQLFLPLTYAPGPLPRGSHYLDVYARVKPGVTVAQSRDEMDRIGRQLENAFPNENRGHGSNVEAMQDDFVRPVRTQLVVLIVAVGFVMLLACVNVASLLLVRAARRSREMAVRAALGAGRIRLLTQSLTESLALAVMGCAVGLVIAGLLIRLLPVVLPSQLSIIQTTDLGLDGGVLAAAAGLSLVTGLLFGALPALKASKPDIVEPLNQGGRSAASISRRVRTALVIGEAALAALTLVGSGLAVRSFAAISAQPLGFEPHGRIAIDVALPASRYKDDAAFRLAMADVETRLTGLPGVSSVGAIDIVPLSPDDSRSGFEIEGRPAVVGSPTRFHSRAVTPTYLRTLAVPIVQGRGFTAQDDERAVPVAIISETAARRFWPNANPIGTRVRFDNDTEVDPWREIVGIAGDVRHWGLSRAVNPMIYLPQAQHVSDTLTFIVKTDRDPLLFVAPIRAAVKAFDPMLPVGNPRTLDEMVAHSLRAERAQTTLMTAFGVLALLLAAIGIYGVMSQLVAARTQEIGVRMTLGARPVNILTHFLGACVWHTAAGLLMGSAAAIYLMHLGDTILFHVKPWDPMTLLVVAATLLTAAMLAAVVPARRAMRIDPTEALRR